MWFTDRLLLTVQICTLPAIQEPALVLKARECARDEGLLEW